MFSGDLMSDCAIMYCILQDIKIESGTARRKLCNSGASALYGYTWRGFLKYDKDGNKVMRKKHPELKGKYLSKLWTDYPELMDIFNEFRDYHFNGFQFSQVMINKNYPVGLHKDKNNVGVSTLISFGDYSGGKTRVYDDIHKRKIDYDSNCNPVQFNGSLYAHEVLPFTGERYALVFFK